MQPNTARHICGEFGQTSQSVRHDTRGAGLVSGTRVLTLNGETPVQRLCVGSHVLTRNFGPVPIIDIEIVSMIAPVVYIIAGSIGHNRQDRDVMMAGDQTIMVRDWRAMAVFGQVNAVTRASTLVDGEFVRDLGQHAVTLYRIYCACPQFIFADGLEMGTANVQITDARQNVA